MGVSNVVFDMGNVLMSFNGLEFSRHFTSGEKDARLLNEALFAGPMWPLQDAGVVEPQTVLRVAERMLPERLWPALHEAASGWVDLSSPLADVNELAIALKREGMGVYVLSNAPRCHIERQLRHAPVWPHLDGWMASGFVRIMKPDPQIFRLFCLRFGLDPASCVFVDDNEDNCAGAREAGMEAIHFTGDVAALESAIRAAR